MLFVNVVRSFYYFFRIVFCCCQRREEEQDLQFYIKEKLEDDQLKEVVVLNSQRLVEQNKRKANLMASINGLLTEFQDKMGKYWKIVEFVARERQNFF